MRLILIVFPITLRRIANALILLAIMIPLVAVGLWLGTGNPSRVVAYNVGVVPPDRRNVPAQAIDLILEPSSVGLTDANSLISTQIRVDSESVTQDPRWLPSGDALLVRARFTNQTWTYHLIEHGQVRTLPHFDTAAQHLRISPDGTQIAYSREIFPNRSDIFVANADGTSPTVLVEGLGDTRVLDWSPDGRYLLFAVMLKRQNQEAGVVEVATSTLHRLPVVGEVERKIAWGKQSDSVIYTLSESEKRQTRSSVWRYDLTTRNATRLFSERSTRFTNPFQYADGTISVIQLGAPRTCYKPGPFYQSTELILQQGDSQNWRMAACRLASNRLDAYSDSFNNQEVFTQFSIAPGHVMSNSEGGAWQPCPDC